MKNIPRIFIDAGLEEGAAVPMTREQEHYLSHVMRTDSCLVFNNGEEFLARVENGRLALVGKTEHADPSGKWIFCFAPIKRMEDLIAGVVQMGAGVLQPVITERTAARHVNWDRMRRVIIENAEQSGRNSLPELRPALLFEGLEKRGLIYGDERKLGVRNEGLGVNNSSLFVGPEGGFSPAEFDALDKGGAVGVSLGATVLRAEVAAIALCAIANEKLAMSSEQ